MAAHDMNNVVKYSHQDITFSTIGDDTTTVLSTLTTILKKQVQEASSTRNHRVPN
jgi:hypothetical protein